MDYNLPAVTRQALQERANWIARYVHSVEGIQSELESAYRQGAREAQQEKADLERLNHKWLIDYGMLAKSKEAENVQARAEGAREAIEQCKKIVDDAFYENPHQAMELNKEIIAAFENYRKELDK